MRAVCRKARASSGSGDNWFAGASIGFVFEARAIVNVWRMGFGASYEFSDDYNHWNVFARFNFGGR